MVETWLIILSSCYQSVSGADGQHLITNFSRYNATIIEANLLFRGELLVVLASLFACLFFDVWNDWVMDVDEELK